MLPSDSTQDPEHASLPLDSQSDSYHRAVASLSEPAFLHPSSIFFEVVSHVRKYLIPAVFAVYSAASGGIFGSGLAVVVFGGALVATLVRYFTLRYRIHENDFIVTEGLLFRRVRSVPIRRIQNVDLVQNIVHRMFGVAEVRIETASGTEPEAILRVLTRRQIEELRAAIVGGANMLPILAHQALGVDDGDSTIAGPTVPEIATIKIIHRISLKQLALAGLASNRGTVFLGVLAGLYFQSQYSWDPTSNSQGKYREWFRINSEAIGNLLPKFDTPGGYALTVSLGLLVLFSCLRLFGIAWYILRFYDHQLTRQANELRISCGLFTKLSATIPRKRIQFISVHRSLLMRWMKLASIRIETAGGGGKQGEDAAATVSRRWFLPVVAEEDVNRLLAELRPGMQWDDAQVTWHAVSPLTGRRLTRFALLFSILLSLIGGIAIPPWGASVGLVSFPILAFRAHKKSRSMRFSRNTWGVAYRSGLLTRKLSFAFYDRIQTVHWKQSPFDRRWKMASLFIDTAAAGPAGHLIDVVYLDAEFARAQFQDLQLATALNRPSWD
jgi:putative membrane protein